MRSAKLKSRSASCQFARTTRVSSCADAGVLKTTMSAGSAMTRSIPGRLQRRATWDKEPFVGRQALVVCPARSWEIQDYARDNRCRLAVFTTEALARAFWAALLLQTLFAVKLQWLPLYGAFDQHLATDVGSTFVALGLALILSGGNISPAQLRELLAP